MKQTKNKTNSFDKLYRSLKSGLVLSALESCGTYVVLSAISPTKEANEVKFLSCKDLLPLGSLVFDSQSDSYIINCFDYIHVGTLPISFVATVKDCPNWSVNVPLPEKVIKNYLSHKQKKDIKDFVSRFDDTFSFNYIQMLDPNL